MGVSRKHTHKYARINLSFGKVWACKLPNCNHYMPPHMEELVNGRYSICWSCNTQFTLNPLNMKMDKPECDECRLGVEEEIPISETLAEKLNNFTKVE